MAILETLYVLFKGDASSVKKSAGEATAAVQSFLGLFAGVASAAAIFSSFKASINDVSTLGNLSRELNVNIEDLDAWGRAIERNGGSAQSFYSSLQSFAEHVGASPNVALQALPALADKLSKLSPFMAQKWGKSLGLDQSTIYLLQQGRREVESAIKRQKELGVTTQHDAEITQKFNAVLSDASNAYKSFYRELAIPLLPGFTKVFDYLVKHKNAVIGAFTGIGGAAVLLAAPSVTANAAVIAVTAAVTALIAAFALVFDDIKTFNEGGKSVTSTIVGIKDSLSSQFKSWSDSLPSWLQVVTGHNSLKSGSTTTGSNFTNPFAGFSLSSLPSLNTLTGHNALRPNVTVGPVTIITQATDGKEIAASFVPSLKDQLSQANSYFDNSVHA